MNFKVYEVSYLIQAGRWRLHINLSRSRPEADLRQDNPSLKHFGSAPRLEFT